MHYIILRCIISNMRYKVRNEDIRNICKNVIKWTRIRKSAWKNHVNWNDNRFAQIVKDEKENIQTTIFKSWTSTSQKNNVYVCQCSKKY